MGKKISNISIISTTLFLIIVVIVVAVFINISNDHNDKLIYATEEKIKYAAKRCYLENKCGKSIKLHELYANNYLDEMVDPITKEVLDYGTTIEVNDETIEFKLK